MGNHLIGQPTGPSFVPGTLKGNSSPNGPTPSTTVSGDQLAQPSGPGQVAGQSPDAPAAQAPSSKFPQPTSNIQLGRQYTAAVPTALGSGLRMGRAMKSVE